MSTPKAEVLTHYRDHLGRFAKAPRISPAELIWMLAP
ncbi:hypothetical protein J2X53_002318 [Pseudorhodobacter sp. 4114]|nr:hypothetical protein [Pseudorhodobacter sp. 4114]